MPENIRMHIGVSYEDVAVTCWPGQNVLGSVHVSGVSVLWPAWGQKMCYCEGDEV